MRDNKGKSTFGFRVVGALYSGHEVSDMKGLLEKAFEAASKLPPDEQEAFAEWLLEELASEQSWRKSFASSTEKLAKLADEALREHRAGKTQELDPEELCWPGPHRGHSAV